MPPTQALATAGLPAAVAEAVGEARMALSEAQREGDESIFFLRSAAQALVRARLRAAQRALREAAAAAGLAAALEPAGLAVAVSKEEWADIQNVSEASPLSFTLEGLQPEDFVLAGDTYFQPDAGRDGLVHKVMKSRTGVADALTRRAARGVRDSRDELALTSLRPGHRYGLKVAAVGVWRHPGFTAGREAEATRHSLDEDTSAFYASGLAWRVAGSAFPPVQDALGRRLLGDSSHALSSPQLAAALQRRLAERTRRAAEEAQRLDPRLLAAEFTEQEWCSFEISELLMSHYIRAGEHFFQPAREAQESGVDQRQFELHSADGWAGATTFAAPPLYTADTYLDVVSIPGLCAPRTLDALQLELHGDQVRCLPPLPVASRLLASRAPRPRSRARSLWLLVP